MSDSIAQLEPKPLWRYFCDLNRIPRPSKQEQRVTQFVQDFGVGLGLETQVDHAGNVLIRKPATAGMENRTPIVLQAHLDMVCQKNAETQFDFQSQGIEMYIEGDWVRARGTTLGADNGLGVASIMTILAAREIPHPPLEALFTVDEETGMTGAQSLKPGWLRGKILLNLDTEEDHVLTIGCAGGCDVTAQGTYTPEPVPPGMVTLRIEVKGLTGGHSGVDIHLGQANANKILTRFLWAGTKHHGLRVAAIDGGGLRNAIPREAFAIVTVPSDQSATVQQEWSALSETVSTEYATTDPKLRIEISPADSATGLLPWDLQRALLASLYACPNGIHRNSPDVPGLVQTSNNLARVLAADGQIRIMCLTRSSVDSERDDLADAIQALFELLHTDVSSTGAYPGWKPRPSSNIVRLMTELYERMFGAQPHVAACHAGLECGIIGRHYPDMEMISFGPTIRGAHSPDESVQISSVQKYWRFLLATLQGIPPVAAA